MSTPRAYRAQRRQPKTADTRDRILATVRTLLDEGAFHRSTVEEVAERAGVSRATLYQHFASRLDLVDAICETLDRNPALMALRDSVVSPDPDQALSETIVNSVRFWSAEEGILSQLYGVVAVDPAASDLVQRQLADRRRGLELLVGGLGGAGWLRSGVDAGRALTVLLLLTSFDTFRGLRAEDLSDQEVSDLLVDAARALLARP